MTLSEAVSLDPRQALEAEIMAAIRVAVEGAGPEGLPAAVLSEGILGVYGDRIDGPDLTMLMLHLALSGRIGYLRTETGCDTEILVALEEDAS